MTSERGVTSRISILCVSRRSNYRLIPGLDLYDKERDCKTFTGSGPVIVHPPCQQWSKMKAFAHDRPEEKELAWFCLQKVLANGGIFEHPAGSSFFKAAGIRPTLSVNQIWWGFPAIKKTWLFFHGYKPRAFPLSFEAPKKTVQNMGQEARSIMPLSFCQYLVDCIAL